MTPDERAANQRKRAERAIEIVQSMADRIDRHMKTYRLGNVVHNLQWSEDYAEPGYGPAGNGIYFADWNEVTDWRNGERVVLSKLMPRLRSILEKLDYQTEWADEWYTCSSCGKAVRTSAVGYSWKPSFLVGDGELTCVGCIADDPEPFLESLEDSTDTSWPFPRRIPPSDHGYVRLNDEPYESGLHPGQNDSPVAIAEALRAKGVSRFLFTLDDTGQFDARFSVWVHESEAELAKQETST